MIKPTASSTERKGETLLPAVVLIRYLYKGDKMVTQERLKEMLSYNILTGEFIRIKPLKGNTLYAVVGSVNNDGYVSISIDNKRYGAHNLVWLYKYGKFPDLQLDHINGVRKDNRFENLREVSHAENQRNKKLDKRNKFGYPGIRHGKRLGTYRACIGVNKTEIQLGTFSTLESAIAARVQAEIKYGFHENHGRIN